MQKMQFPLNISFREFEKIIQQRLYQVFGTLPGQVEILFIYLEGKDASYFLKLIAGDTHGTYVYVHLQYDTNVSDYIYNITDLPAIKKSVLKQVSAR